MRLRGFLEPLMESKKFKDIERYIKNDSFPISISGASESGRSYLISGMYENLKKSMLIVTNSDGEARNLYEDLSFYTSNVYYFPTKEVVFYNIDAISGDLRWERLKIIKQMTRRTKKIIITSIENLAPRYIPLELYKEYTFKFKVGSTINTSDLACKLISSGYERVEAVYGRGEFSIRGGIIDIFSPIEDMPYRIELFGDEVDSIRTFNTESQRSIEKVKLIEIFPAKEIILQDNNVKYGYENIKNDLLYIEENTKFESKEYMDRIKQETNSNLESLKETGTFETIDSFLPYFYKDTSSFLDYINDSIIVLDDVKRSFGKLESVYLEFKEGYENFFARGNVLPNQINLLFDKQEIIESIINNKLVSLDAIAKVNDVFKATKAVDFSEITLSSYQGQVELLIEDIKEKKSKGYKTVILSGTKTRGQRLVETLREQGIESIYKDEIDSIQYGEVIVTFGNQIKGFEYPELKLCAISDKDVFGQSKRKSRKKNKKGVNKIKSFNDLKPGDYVVHTNHGIGIYKGIKQLNVDGNKKDYLEITYSSDDKLYVPVEQLDLVQKYIGNEDKGPKVSKLGSTEWTKTKNKVKKSVKDIAENLVELYAVRSTIKGHKYAKDTIWQKQFEDEFPFEETPDQLSAISDIKRDMQSDKAMDRLLCGDVGYGKTEVALRAAFKAVMDGKQVAFLVPTTILSEQHYNNLRKRFSDFPINVDMISRFRTPSQQKAIIKAVKEGNVDVLIGTHRILQKDIKFKDLGLLIVDEEQRFGVAHKEKIKNLKKNVDVLTLSATPIPRTLHMSLVGVRDISVIETPPEERYPIQTYVVEYNEQLIRDAIIREINREGQVFFVYNRVNSIKEMASYINNLVPEAKVAIAHGQMTERELEKVMINFMNKECNVLICTTIIETGIDIQNSNTMIIYDADKMGLSQLYQLRGRVGRSNRIAYAYFTYRKDKLLTEVAEKRLKAIKEFTELGSGFKIAMRDLEIRGAGNMMGSSQHGHMAAVGYDLYCRMLEDTIKIVRGEIEKEPVDTTIELKVDAYIPDKYVKDEIQKIEVYKKIAAIDGYEDMQEIIEELEDRFSNIPLSVQNLINIAYLKSVARLMGVEEIKESREEFLIKFESAQRINQNFARKLLSEFSGKIMFRLGEKPVVVYKLKGVKKEEILDTLKRILEYMLNQIEKK